jgi:hypothetical protein
MKEILLFSPMSGLALEPMQPPVKQVLVLFPGHKAVRVCTDHSPPSSTHVNNEWNYTSTHSICFQEVEKHNVNFYLVWATVLSFVKIYSQRLHRIPSTYFPKIANYFYLFIYSPHMYLKIECNTVLMCIFSFWLLENFTDHEIDLTTFTSLTDADLREIGVSTVGARRKMLFLSSGK